MKKPLSLVSKCNLAIIIILLFAVISCQRQTADVITEAEAEMIGDLYCEARNNVDLSILDKVYSPDAVIHDCSQPEDIIGLDVLKEYYAGNHKAIPDLHMSLNEMIVKGDKIIWIWRITGTNTGSFGELPPTNKAVDFSGVAIDRVVNGKIVEEWIYFNPMVLFNQLGFNLVPPSEN